MLEKWKKDYNDLLKGIYVRPKRWYDCRNKYPFINEEQQIPCRSLKCTSFHCNHARTEIDGKIRLARFFIIKPNVCAVIKFKELPFLMDDEATSMIKKYLHQKLIYQRKKILPFEFECKMELDLKFIPHLHMSIKFSDEKRLSKVIKQVKKILRKVAKKAVIKYCKEKKYSAKKVKIVVYCDKIRNLKKYANYISKRGKHLKKLVIFPESWNTKTCRITCSTKGLKPLKSKELLAYYYKNKSSIINWGRFQNKLDDSKPLIAEAKTMEPFGDQTNFDEKTRKLQNAFVFTSFSNWIWRNSLNVLMAIFLAVFSIYLIRHELLETEKTNTIFSDLEFKLKHRKIIQAAIGNIQTAYLPRNDFHQKE